METFLLSTNSNYVVADTKEKNGNNTKEGWEYAEHNWDLETLVKITTTTGLCGSHLKGGFRKKKVWQEMGTLTLDLDTGKPTAGELLMKQDGWKFNTYIHSSQSHGIKHDKIHLLIPLKVPITRGYDLEAIIRKMKVMFPTLDTSCFDKNRFFAHGTTVISSITTGKGGWDWESIPNLYEGMLDIETWTEENEKPEEVPTFHLTDIVKTAFKGDMRIKDIVELGHTAIFCPFCIEDGVVRGNAESANAFIDKSSSELPIMFCSSCKASNDSSNDRPEPRGISGSGLYQLSKDDILKDYWTVEEKTVKMGFGKNYFYTSKVSQKSFEALTGIGSLKKDHKAEVMRKFLVSKHIFHLEERRYLSDSSAEENFYRVERDNGVINIHHKPLDVVIKDNAWWERYLQDLFGEHKDIMKGYLAVYCHSNYKKLPTILLTGPRGTGKSKFVEILMAIYPALSTTWKGTEGDFNYECLSKMLIIEENSGDHMKQYKTFKSYSGDPGFQVNMKNEHPFFVKNNMNMVVTSNEAALLFAKLKELPTDSKNNQWFVYEMHKPAVQNSNIAEEAIARLGHYVRTELKDVYDNLPENGYRYTINVPITDAEKRMFNSSRTKIEQAFDRFITLMKDSLTNEFQSRFTKTGFVMSEIITLAVDNTSRLERESLVNRLTAEGYLETGEIGDVKRGGDKKGCYEMGDILQSLLADKTVPSNTLEGPKSPKSGKKVEVVNPLQNKMFG